MIRTAKARPWKKAAFLQIVFELSSNLDPAAVATIVRTRMRISIYSFIACTVLALGYAFMIFGEIHIS